MSKRLEHSTQFLPRKHRKSNGDGISQLPDEILVEILSHMHLREAVQTSVISHRWKNLWMFTTGNLEFEAPHALEKIRHNSTWVSDLEKERNKFSNWVNQVLNSHKGGRIGALRVSFALGITRKSTLDRWIDFAIHKKVWCLDIRLMPLYGYLPAEELYTFPKEVLGYSNIKFLKALCLSFINVTGPLLEDILSKCTSLEELSVTKSPTLVHAKICGPSSLKLKCLEIRYCGSLQLLEVSAPNLLVLSYVDIQVNTKIHIHNAPKLEALLLGGLHFFGKIPLPYCSQLDTLELDCSLYRIWEIPPVFPKFKSLKHLKLKVPTKDENSLVSCISLLKACPMLHTLEVVFSWRSSEHKPRKMVKIEREELKCLKVVKFSWFAGRTSDVELAICILENAPYLEKMIFDPWRPSDWFGHWIWDCSKKISLRPSWDRNDDRMAARECAEQLAKDHSPRAKLIVF